MVSKRSAGRPRPYRLPVPAALVACAIVAAAVQALAGTAPGPPGPEPWESAPFTADPVAVARAAERAGDGQKASALVLLSDSRLRFDEGGRCVSTHRLVYRIQTAQADESWSQIEALWSPWYESRPRLRARVITPDGTVHPLDPATITESPEQQLDQTLFGDRRVLRAPLPATGPGAVVEQEVTTEETAPFFDRGIQHRQTLAAGAPVRLARLTIEVPAAMTLRWAVRRLPAGEPQEAYAGGRRRVSFEYRDLPAVERIEPGLPSDVPRFPHVAFSTGRSWSEVASRYSEIVDGTIGGADLTALLGGAPPAGSQRERIEGLLARVRKEVRYTGVELGQQSIVPRLPGEILKSRYGDCKDQAALLTAALRAAGIPAYVALLDAGGEEDVEASLPGFGGFDHAIVFVPGDPAVWIDPTSPYAHAGELPGADQGRLALVASPTATSLLRTPEAPSTANREAEAIEIFLSELGPARLVVTSEWTGALEREMRGQFAGLDPEAARKAMKGYIASNGYLGKDLASLDHPDPTDLSIPFRLRLEAKEAGRGYTDRAEAAVGIPLTMLLARLPEEIREEAKEGEEERQESSRKDDYVLMPFVREVRYRIVPPAGFVPRELPKARKRTIGNGTLSEEYRTEAGGVVRATLQFDAGKRRLTPRELAAARAAYREIAKEAPVQVQFNQVGETALAAGKTREALDEFGQLVAAAPQKALPRTRRARALLAGGMGEEARREAERAVALEPGSAVAQRTLGWILQHDALGRRFGHGFDRPRAVAAYRKALELGPTDWETRADLAILLEHDARGWRYTREADLAAAIAEYRAVREGSKSEGMTDNLLTALWRQGEAGDVRVLLGKLPVSTLRSALSLAATALLDGPEAATREADQRLADPKARIDALEGAATNLTLLRRYPQAAALLTAAAKSAAEPVSLLARAALLQKVRRYDQAILPHDRPESIAQRLFLLSASEGVDPEPAKRLVSRDLARKMGSGDPLSRAMASFRPAVLRQGMPVEVLLDVGLALLHTTLEGDEGIGYRVRISYAMSGATPDLVVFALREDGEYRIAAVEAAPDSLGAEAMRRAGRNDWKGARQWLDWARAAAPATRGEDPLEVPPITRLWSKGSPAGEEEVRCAAASLMAQGKDWSVEAVPILLRCRAAAGDEAHRTAYDLALAAAYDGRERNPELLEVAGRLHAANPGSEKGFELEMVALARMLRWDEFRESARRRLRNDPDDAAAERALAVAAMETGGFDEFATQVGRLISQGKAKPVDYNDLAWVALVRGRVGETDLENAQHAATLDEYKSRATLHTLASLYAELGRTAEAYKVILQSIAASDGDPRSADWYVFGKLAERYGLPETARGYYERVTADERKKAEPTSTYKLAQARLAVLGGASPGPARP